MGRLLSPRWRAASPLVRAINCVAGALAVALLVAFVLTVLPAKLVHRGPVAFRFQYRGLYREAPDPGGYVRVARHGGGRLLDSFAVEPLTLPNLPGSVTAVLPLAAAAHEQQLAQRDPNFALQSEGRTKINSVPAYAINYSTRIDGRRMDVRDVLMVPPASGARQGVVLVLATRASPLHTDQYPVGYSGVLREPERTFMFGA